MMKLSNKIILIVICSTLILLISNFYLIDKQIKKHLQSSQSEWVVTLAEAISEGITQGTINKQVIDVSDILQQIAKRDRAIEYLYVIDFNRQLFAYSFEGGFPRYLMEKMITHDPSDHQSSKILEYFTHNSEIDEYYVPLIDGMGAELHIGVNQQEINAVVKSVFRDQLLLTLSVGLIVMLLTWLMARRLVKPLSVLANEMRSFGQGELIQHLTIKSNDAELSQLISIFNQMVVLRSQAEADLKNSEAKLSLMLNSIGDAVIATDATGHIVMMNPVAEQLSGYQSAEVISRPLDEVLVLVHAFTREKVDNPVGKVLKTGKIVGLANHTVLINRYKHEYQIADSAAPIVDEQNVMHGIILVFRDVTEDYRLQQAEKEALQRLERQEQELNQILDTLDSGVVKIDQLGRILSVNRTLKEIYGYTEQELLGQNVNILMPEPYHNQHDGFLKKLIASGRKILINFNRELEGIRKNGEVFPLRLSIAELPKDSQGNRYFVGAIYDVTEQKLQENLLRRAQKMDALGQLTGGIAHDFNNQLGVVQGYLEFLKGTVDSQSKQQQWIEKASKATRHCIDLSRKLLNFSSSRLLNTESVDINYTLKDMHDLISRILTPKITLEYHLAEGNLAIIVNSSELEDAMLNLVVNARDAMPSGGKLTITTQKQFIDQHYANIHRMIEPGEYVAISISDTGVGVSKQDLERVFEPFFTTKERGSGTGLGLAMVYSFAKRAKGLASLYSEENYGTTIKLLLPITDQSLTKTSEPEDKAKMGLALPHGQGEKILVVDDEPELLTLAETYLKQLGYLPVGVSNAKQALEHLQQDSNIHLLFSDVIMPGDMSGIELAVWVQKNFPQIKILLTSGFTGNGKTLPQTDELSAHFLHKPYSKTELARHIAETLASDSSLHDEGDKRTDQLSEIKWKDAYAIGYPQLDHDHKHFFCLLQRFQALLISNDKLKNKQLSELLSTLLQHTQQQFTTEQKILEDNGYPFVKNHINVHNMLVTDIEKACQDCRETPGQFDYQVFLNYLCNWMVNHIESMDRRYIDFIKQPPFKRDR